MLNSIMSRLIGRSKTMSNCRSCRQGRLLERLTKLVIKMLLMAVKEWKTILYVRFVSSLCMSQRSALDAILRTVRIALKSGQRLLRTVPIGVKMFATPTFIDLSSSNFWICAFIVPWSNANITRMQRN